MTDDATPPTCGNCGSPAKGRSFCTNCGQPFGADGAADQRTVIREERTMDARPTTAPTMPPPVNPWQAETHALATIDAMGSDRRRRRKAWLALPVMVIVGVGVGLGLTWFLNHDDSDNAATSETGAATEQPETRSSDAPSTSPDPSESASSSPTGPLRTCWDDSETREAEGCPLPTADEAGMRAASPDFADALDSGACTPDKGAHTKGGYHCTITTSDYSTAQVHFAWYANRKGLDRHFRRRYPACQPADITSLQLCGSQTGVGRLGLRYNDRQILFAITVSRDHGGADVLNALDVVPLQKLKAGKR